MFFLQALFIFILGLNFGSFANVLIDRTEKKKSLLGRSRCDHCGYQLKWFDNIPVLSFLFLRGRCRKCGKEISAQYPLVEFSTGVLFLFVFLDQVLAWPDLFFGAGKIVSLAFLLWVSFLLWVIFIWDLKYMIIPDNLILAGFLATLGYFLFLEISGGSFLQGDGIWLSALWGSLILGFFFGGLFFISGGRWIGGGDVKLGFWLGFLVGWKLVYPLLLISYVLGAIVAVGLILIQKKGWKSQVPFGPFLVIGAFAALFFPEEIFEIWEVLFR